MARGTDFGGVHSHKDLHLIQQKVEVQPANPKLNLIEIPGADGSRDLSTQPAGRVVYADRKITWTFALYPGENWDAKHSQVSGALNGRYCRITLDTDPGYYYLGRLVVSKHKVDGLLRQITVEAQCRPYKLRQMETRVFVPFCGKNLLNVSPDNQITPLYGSVEYIPGGIRKSGKYYVGYRVFVNPNTVYFLSASVQKITENSPFCGQMAVYDKDGRTAVSVFPGMGGSVVRSFNSGNNSELTVLFYSDGDADPGVCEFTNIQIEPLRATDYEPYLAEPRKEVSLLNDRKPVVPTIICTGETTLTVDGASAVLNTGTHKVLDFQLAEGLNQVTLEGSGAAAIIYQEGAL